MYINENYPFPIEDGYCAPVEAEETQPMVLESLQRRRVYLVAPANENRGVNPDQLTALNALIAYVSFLFSESEACIERALLDHFRIACVKYLPAPRFEDAIRFLADLMPETQADLSGR